MKRLMLAVAVISGAGGNLASAQSLRPGSETVSPAPAVDAPAATAQEVVPSRGAVVPAQGLNDPNTTGPDKVNGLEVPQMKDPRDGGRE